MRYTAFYEEMLEDDLEDTATAGFWGWYQQSGSWQSSWKANRKKQRQQQGAAQQTAQHQQSQSDSESGINDSSKQRQQHAAHLSQLLLELDASTLQVVHSIFGKDLEHLHHLGVSNAPLCTA